MDKWELVRRMKESVGGADFISLTEFSHYMGIKDPYKVRKKYLSGLERVGTKYFIPDVAGRITEEAKR